MSDRSIFVIINPRAGRGRGARRIERFRELLALHLGARTPVREALTERPGHEAELAERALDEGHHSIVAIGGDGTWSAVADRIVAHERTDCTLGLFPSGTGNDFGKTFGLTWANADAIVRGIAVDRKITIDVGRVGARHFLNVVGLGFDIAVIEDAERVPVLKGDVLYRFCALRQLFGFPGVRLSVHADPAPDAEPAPAGSAGAGSAPLPGGIERLAAGVDHLMLIVANARIFGGSFLVAPDASLTDGRLDLVSIADAKPWRRARLFGLVSRGEHAGEPEVTMCQGAAFEIRFEPPLRYEVDGEVLLATEPRLAVRAVPGALSIHVPPGPEGPGEVRTERPAATS